MKKRSKHQLMILRKLALKSFKRKVRSKRQKKRWNKQLLGVPKQKQKQNSVRFNIQQRLKEFKNAGYKVLDAPKLFSLTENTEKSLEFIGNVDNCFKKNKKVFVNLHNVETIAHGSIVVLLSILVKFKAHKILFNGNYPKNKKARNNLIKSGFFEYLFNEDEIQLKDEYSFEKDIRTHANKKVAQDLSDKIIKRASKFIWQEERSCTGVQRVFIELMQNSFNHASSTKQGEHHWWTTVYYAEQSKKVCFAFIDYGIGILESLTRKETSHKFFGIIQKIQKKFNSKSNADMLKHLLDGDMHRTVKEYYRGKGLPGIFDACKNNKI